VESRKQQLLGLGIRRNLCKEPPGKRANSPHGPERRGGRWLAKELDLPQDCLHGLGIAAGLAEEAMQPAGSMRAADRCKPGAGSAARYF